MTRRLGLLACALVGALAVAGGASASGGTTIANAPGLTAGAQQTGDTRVDTTTPGDNGIGYSSGCWRDLEWWQLPLTAGDQVTITGGGVDPGYGLLISVFPPGTNDRTVSVAVAVKSGFPLSAPMKFGAPSTGTYAVAAGPNCYNGVDGPFRFSVAITHDAVTETAFVRLPKSEQVKMSGPIVATVVTPAGSLITDPDLSLQLTGTWKDTPASAPSAHVLGTATPASGRVQFAVRFPAAARGQTVRLQVTGKGKNYNPVTSRVLTAKIG
jgi:hypothetical protein